MFFSRCQILGFHLCKIFSGKPFFKFLCILYFTRKVSLSYTIYSCWESGSPVHWIIKEPHRPSGTMVREFTGVSSVLWPVSGCWGRDRGAAASCILHPPATWVCMCVSFHLWAVCVIWGQKSTSSLEPPARPLVFKKEEKKLLLQNVKPFVLNKVLQGL